jgi:hypothetical protein
MKAISEAKIKKAIEAVRVAAGSGDLAMATQIEHQLFREVVAHFAKHGYQTCKLALEVEKIPFRRFPV